jgi:hypothetical protein
MQKNLPLGQEGLFDCYNFCNGIFVSSCSEGICATTECEEAGADGSLLGIVTGCTIEHLNVQLTEPAASTSNSADGPSLVLSFAFLALALKV